jgi:two-component system, NtrC family, response regulator AtoC
MRKSRVLVIDDEQMIRWSVEQTLSAVGHDVIGAATAAEGLAAFRRTAPQVVFLDVRLPDGDGLSVLGKIKEEGARETAVIVMTAYGEVRTAVEAMRLGALDYLKKPFDFDELEVLVNRALETTDLKREVGELREEKKRTYSPGNIVGESDSMQTVLRLLDKIAESDAATVLIQGENGTGKDLFAHAIHYRSRRAAGPFVDIGCTAMPETLLESEVFGYEKGAFTDARSTKRGLLELANGGTLFLDEIGDMPLSSQAKLLRVLDNKRFKRLGGTEDHQVDVRIVAATNRDLEAAVRERRFREDLYYRLKVIPVMLPPLRQRRDDIPLLLQHYMEKYSAEFHKDFRRVSEEALRLLLDYPWPGNVRELRNLVERIMILESGETVLPEHLPPEMSAGTRNQSSQPDYTLPPSGICLEHVEKEFVRQALDLAQGNQTRAAQLLTISRDALRYRMQKFGLTG